MLHSQIAYQTEQTFKEVFDLMHNLQSDETIAL